MLFVNLKTLYVRFQTTFKNDVAIMVSLWVIVKAYVFVSHKTICIKSQTSFKNDVAFRVSQNLIVRKHIIVAWTFNSVCSMLQQATRLNVQSQILVRERFPKTLFCF